MRLFDFGTTIAIAAAFVGSANASANGRDDCEARFSQDSVTLNLLANELGHDQVALADEDVRILAGPEPSENTSCRVSIRVSLLSSDGSFPSYSLTASGAPLRPSISETVGGASETAVTVPASRTGRTVNLRATAPTDWGIQSGQYVERLQLSLVDKTGTIIDRMAVNLVLQIPKTVDVMFVGATGVGRTTTIDLGDLSATEQTLSPPFGVRIWSSSAYSFGFTSEHSGLLQHELAMDAIPYRLNVNGQSVALDGNRLAINRLQPSQRSGDFHSLTLSVPARRSVAGRYKDRLTVSVSAL